MKVNAAAMSVVVVLAALLGAGTWYINAVYLPKAQMEKAESLKTEAGPREMQSSDYDYTVPVDEQAIAAERAKQEQQATDSEQSTKTEPAAETVSSEGGAQEDTTQPSDVWITRDYEHGGETHVSTVQPPTAETKPAASEPPAVKPTAQASPKPVKPTPQPEPDPVAPSDAEPPAVTPELGEEQMPKAGEVRIIDGQTLAWYDGWGWIPEEAATAMKNSDDSTLSDMSSGD